MRHNKIKELIISTCRELRKEQTTAECLLWEELKNRKLLNKKFIRQFPIKYEYFNKRSFFIVDFICYEKKLIIEIDGEIHNKLQLTDKLRTEVLNNLGFNVIRFSNEDILNNMSNTLEEIKKHLIS